MAISILYQNNVTGAAHDVTTLITAVKLMPFMLVSLFAGIAVSKKIDDRRIRKLVLLLLVVSGAMLIAQNL